MAKREAVLSYIVDTFGGMHPGGWRQPDAPDHVAMNLAGVRKLVETAERGKFHLFFLADAFSAMESDPEIMSSTSNAVKYEPFTLASALAMVTNDIGLAVTGSTTYAEPYNIARMYASLDHLSGGRAAWNVVASTEDGAPLFNGYALGHAKRYERASEFFDVVTSLWDSWDDDAFTHDKATGQYFRPEGMHVPDHRGDFFQVRGPLNVSRPVQGHPVIAQAGASPAGLALATRIADVVFAYDQGIDHGRDFYARLKDGAADQGRKPDDVKLLLSLLAIVGRTQAEAEDKFAALEDLADPRVGIDRLKVLIDFDLSPYPLDEPVPVEDIPVTEEQSRSIQDYYLDRARKDGLSVRQLALVAMQFDVRPMSVEAIADHIEERIEADAADGFNIGFGDALGSLGIFVDHVVPELQRRGLFHRDYTGSTLRENLGVSRPANPFTTTR